MQEIKQIAGRAGRFGTQYENGEVTCMTYDDLKYVRQGMQVTDEPIIKAGMTDTASLCFNMLFVLL